MENEYTIIPLKSAWADLASMPFFFLNVQIAGSFVQLHPISARDLHFSAPASFSMQYLTHLLMSKIN